MKSLQKSLIQFIQRSKKTLLLIIIVSAATLLISTMVSIWLNSYHNLHFPSLGIIRVIHVDAYGGDMIDAQNGKQIDWGTVYLGIPTNRSFYIKSISNVPVILNLIFANLTFQNSREENVTENLPLPINQTWPISLTWDYNNKPLSKDDEIYVTLTLKISSDNQFIEYIINNDVNKFSFDISIKPVEQ